MSITGHLLINLNLLQKPWSPPASESHGPNSASKPFMSLSRSMRHPCKLSKDRTSNNLDQDFILHYISKELDYVFIPQRSKASEVVRSQKLRTKLWTKCWWYFNNFICDIIYENKITICAIEGNMCNNIKICM